MRFLTAEEVVSSCNSFHFLFYDWMFFLILLSPSKKIPCIISNQTTTGPFHILPNSLLIVLLFDAIPSSLLTALLNKSQTNTSLIITEQLQFL